MENFAYACLTCTIDNNPTSFYFSSVEDTSIDASATVCKHPLITGDYVKDHMYRDADSASLSGIITSSEKSVKENEIVPTLRRVEEIFERIKDEGITCSLVKFVPNKGENDSFKIRNNLVLNNIHWDEGVNTLKFRFSFEEVMFSESVQLDVDIDDELMPNIAEVTEKTFTESLFKISEVKPVIVNYLAEEGLVTKDFYDHFFSLNMDQNWREWVTGGVTGAVAGLTVLAATGVGAVAIAAGAAVGVICYAICKGIHGAVVNNKFKVNKFDKWSDGEKKRFEELLKSIENELNQLNNVVRIYQLTDNNDQQVVLTFVDEYVTMKFMKSNTDVNTVRCEVLDKNESLIKSVSNISNFPNNFADLKSSSALYTKNDTYLFCAYLGAQSSKERQTLTNYAIVISSIKPENIGSAISQIVRQYIFK